MNFLDNRKNRTITVVCCLIALICIYLIQDDSLFRMMSSSSTEDIGSFDKLEKDVRKKELGNYFWEDLSTRDRLTDGDSIFTGAGSSVTVKLYGGQIITIAPNSLIKFRTKNKKLVIDIPYGGVELNNVVKDLVITDCGQDFNLNQGQDSIKLKKSEKCGSVTVDTKSVAINKDFKEKKLRKDVKETFFEVADTGTLALITPPGADLKPPEVASNLAVLTAPKFDNLDIKYKVSSEKPLVLKWKPVDTAQSYEIEVSETPDFVSVEKFQAKQPLLSLNKITSNLFFRGKSLGQNDRISDLSEIGKVQVQFPRIKIDKPVVSKDYKAKNPADEGSAESFDVSWSTVPAAAKYTVEVRDPVSHKTIKKFTTRSPASAIEVPKTGKFAYQIHALDAKGRKISSSDMGEVLYNKVFAIVAPIIQQELSDKFYFFQKNAGKYVWLNWIPQGSESRFRVEIATDKDFTTIIKSVFSTKKKLLVTDKIQEGEYFWRVRAEDKEQFSAWSNTETFKVKVGP